MPLSFMSMATISMAPTPLFSTAPKKSLKSRNGLPGPQMPSLGIGVNRNVQYITFKAKLM